GPHGVVFEALVFECAGAGLFCYLQHAAHQHQPPARDELAGRAQHRPQSQPEPMAAAALRRRGGGRQHAGQRRAGIGRLRVAGG
nr:hypothetical protein [Tanacetum cinerariifolium]